MSAQEGVSQLQPEQSHPIIDSSVSHVSITPYVCSLPYDIQSSHVKPMQVDGQEGPRSAVCMQFKEVRSHGPLPLSQIDAHENSLLPLLPTRLQVEGAVPHHADGAGPLRSLS